MTKQSAEGTTYIRAAEFALRMLRRPASAIEICGYLRDDDRFSRMLGGHTPHKTIQARISTDIKRYGSKSRFYRTGPATYALRELGESGFYPPEPKRLYVGFNRAKQIDSTPVCTIDLGSTRFRPSSGFLTADDMPLRFLRHLPLHYHPRREALHNPTLLTVNLFLVVMYENQVLCFEPTDYDEDNEKLKNKDAAGITGYLQGDDIDLFDTSGIGFRNAAEREFYDFFHLFYSDCFNSISSVEYAGSVYDDFSEERRLRLGLVSLIKINQKIETESVKLGVKNMHWQKFTHIPNSFYKMEPWSRMVFRTLYETSID